MPCTVGGVINNVMRAKAVAPTRTAPTLQVRRGGKGNLLDALTA
jgi:hypothetical protein